jgi:hypothetical protein
MATLAEIRKRYSVPAKRGMQARFIYGGHTGVVTGAPRSRMRVNIRCADGKTRSCHPFELDYLVDGEWVRGEALKNKYDGRWDAWNKRANELIAAKRI